MRFALSFSNGKIQATLKDINNDPFPLLTDVFFNSKKLDEEISRFSLQGRVNHVPPFEVSCKIPEDLKRISFAFFDEVHRIWQFVDKKIAVSLADYYFNVFSHCFWRKYSGQGYHLLATKALEAACSLATEWESLNQNRHVHKGTPYYFLTSSYMLSGDLDSMYASIFKAIEEDKKSKGASLNNLDAYKDSPAYSYLVLKDSSKNYLYGAIKNIRTILNDYIKELNQLTNWNFSLKEMDQKFSTPDLEDIRFLFNYSLESYLKYQNQFAELPIQNDFYRIRNAQNIFDMCLVVDKILETRFENDFLAIPRRRRNEMTIANGVYHLFDHKGWITGIPNPGSLKGELEPKVLDIKPDDALPLLFRNDVTLNGNPISVPMSVFIMTWLLRNFAGHHIERQRVFTDNYGDIIKRVLWATLISLMEM